RSQIDRHAVELSDRVQPPAGRKLKQHFAPGSRAKRVLTERRERQRVHGGRFVARPEHHSRQGLVRMRVWEGVNPEHLGGKRNPHGGVAAGLVTEESIEVAVSREAGERDVLRYGADNSIVPRGNRRKRTGPHTDAALLDRK